MLELKNITKVYRIGDISIPALNGISLTFRKSEFVCVLGPSGCGKTTLLNIVGGLDKPTSGEMSLMGKSTKSFKDRDWDSYRNHSVGFVFQNYNLIPHQTILSNVELSLSIAGISRKERVQRAKHALDRVGLSGLYYKKPNQLSGGQSQRVAIARALVNDPEILLADEPTGALDSVTSGQIMDLIKEIAKTKLVIMVTHNSEIANKYATRLVSMKDGLVLSDTNPYTAEPSSQSARKEKGAEGKRVKMSLFTAIRLSMKNLFSKKGRTILTGIAGSIGIVGVSVVLALSFGIQNYIQSMQRDMLSGYPISVSRSTVDINAILENASFGEQKEIIVENGYVHVDEMLDYVVSRSGASGFQIENEITRTYVDFLNEMPAELVNEIYYDYGFDLTGNIFTDFYTENAARSQRISLAAIKAVYSDVLRRSDLAESASYISMLDNIFAKSFSNEDFILSQYDLVSGSIPTAKDEIVLVLNNDGMLSDLLLAQLGYYTQDEFLNIVYNSLDDPKFDESSYKTRFSYGELLGKSFTWYPNDTVFDKTEDPMFAQINPFTHKASYDGSFVGGVKLKVAGILAPKEDINYGVMKSGIYYTEALAQHILSENSDSEISAFLKSTESKAITSTRQNDTYIGITFRYSYVFNGAEYNDQTGIIGSSAGALSFLSGGAGGNYLIYTLQQSGGSDLPYEIDIFPKDFETKEEVLDYLDRWNSDETLTVNGAEVSAADRSDVTYSDNLSVVMSMVGTFIDVVTYSLVGFTALSLLVSCVMIGIITYISVVERTNEIGVIRSLGGRKRDVANLFSAETFLIGLVAGLIGIVVTYGIVGLLNGLLGRVLGVAAIAVFPFHYALIMTLISVGLTLISGILPSMSAAHKDPVVALRTI